MSIKAISSVAGPHPQKPEAERPKAEVGVPVQGRAADPQPDRPQAAALARAVEDLNRHAQNLQRELRFSIHESTGRTVVQVVDPGSKEVIRQIPPEVVLNVAEALQQGLTDAGGWLLEDKA